ncbi:type I restriction endonuclease subunit R [Porphyromonas sp. COT-290 OH3588]|uniref:type I restriction endonuclease subunit R n=1 Tax=Porphyromonas sp. COT-290 OH3588 TaxID=1515617 RepID=UPI00052C8C3C|nr:type I restriction endonuclease subunit R [Porphyromonas sp. COT-290 OH3588]KGO01075.1 DEAD/DEAH box helicase [Porphyromonas sp. COT-290 OH3588]
MYTTEEQTIEERLIKRLESLKYIYRHDIKDRATLEANFRHKFEQLNAVKLTDREFERLLSEITKPDVYDASRLLRERNLFLREDGTPLNYTLVNIKDWCKNDYEVINQLRINTHSSHHRYDVIILINGLPLVQIELKAHKISPRVAMQQIVNYKNDTGNGYLNTLLCFVQLFIVSNEGDTCYFSNNNPKEFLFDAKEQYLPVYYLADETNHKIRHLHSFATRLLAKCSLGELISRYMVLVASERKLLIMRPYQIYAVQAIIKCIEENRGNGYIWHTTGSGKTLTSFKASTLLKDNPNIEKCLFVVDRKDLDRQTRDEFNKFQQGCVEENTNTETLVRRLESTDYADKVIVTTIQKLGIALDPKHKKNYHERLRPLSDKRVVFIFDECHRSQFGDNHKAIKAFFPKAQLFGFTGTPIFEENAVQIKIDGQEASKLTTDDIFQKPLHTYTITNAIEDENVLRFNVDYYRSNGEYVRDRSLVTKRAIIEEILSKHDTISLSRCFNAILATSSINDAIEYYRLFKTLQAECQATNPNFTPLSIACVFSPPAEGNKDVEQMQEDLEQEKLDNQTDPSGKKQALQEIISDYNSRYGCAHSLAEFDLYYQDVQKRIKDQKWAEYPREQKIDITIVVDMLLTGFDSKYLGILYVDKDLKYHGLIQAFSRTNRTLNKTKNFGKILDFRFQESAVNDAVQRFSGVRDEDQDPKIWLVEPANKVVEQYEIAIQQLTSFMESKGLEAEPENVYNLLGDTAKAEFVDYFKEVQKLNTQLSQYIYIDPQDQEKIEKLMPPERLNGFRSAYLETAKTLRNHQKDYTQDQPVDMQNAHIEEIDFEFVLFSSAIIDYDYIMGLIARLTSQSPSQQKLTKEELVRLVASHSNLIEEQEDILDYIEHLEVVNGLTVKEVSEQYQAFKTNKLQSRIKEIAHRYNVAIESLSDFISSVLDRMIFDADQLSALFYEQDLGWKQRVQQEKALVADLMPLFSLLAKGQHIAGLSAYKV